MLIKLAEFRIKLEFNLQEDKKPPANQHCHIWLWRTLWNLKNCSAEFCETSWLFPGLSGRKQLTKCISKPGVHYYSSFWAHWQLFRFIQGIPVSKHTSTEYFPHWKKGASFGTKNTGPPETSLGKILLRTTAGPRVSQFFHLLGHGAVQAEIQSCKEGGMGAWILVAFLLPAEAEHDRVVYYRAQESEPGAWQHSLCRVWGSQNFFFFSSYFFLLTLTQNMGINLTSFPFLAAVEHGEVSISTLGAVSSCGPNKHFWCWCSCCDVWQTLKHCSELRANSYRLWEHRIQPQVLIPCGVHMLTLYCL